MFVDLEAHYFWIFIALRMSFTDTARHWLWGCVVPTAASRSKVKVAIPHLRGR